MQTIYEKHNYRDPEFPIFFHLDKLEREKKYTHTHWHEHTELLYIIKGSCTVRANGVSLTAKSFDVVMITPNCIHDIENIGDGCQYYCITVDKAFCDSFKIPACAGQFAAIINDSEAKKCFESIVEIMKNKPAYYHDEAKAIVLRLLIRCCREGDSIDDSDCRVSVNPKMITLAIDYLRAHFSEPVTVNELCEYLGFSKFYFCRRFKQATGKTMVDYLNFLRCSNAKMLIASGQYNVSESAQRSGFNNMSYFTKVYQRQMGCRPSEETVNIL